MQRKNGKQKIKLIIMKAACRADDVYYRARNRCYRLIFLTARRLG